MEKIRTVLQSGKYILAKEVENFEKEFAKFLGIDHCVGVASGTDALSLALKAVGVGCGDEVITVSHSAVATVVAIEQIGARPVFADIDPVTRCLDPKRIAPLISKKTRAIVPVHIYGQPAPMEELLLIAQKHALRVVEDAAQAHGAKINGKNVGTFGDAAAFSFYPTKNLGALGDAGAVVTHSCEIAEKIKMLRQYGWAERFISSVSGVNSRLDEIQAAILRTKLPLLEERNQRRRNIADCYRAALEGKDILSPGIIENTIHAMHLFVVECDNRMSFRKFLKKEGIDTAIHYPLAIHQQPAYKGRIRGSDKLRVTENLYRRIISLPMYPELTETQIETVCSALRKWR